MIDITEKRVTLRRAIAQASVHVSPETAAAIREGRIAKGSVEDVSRAAGLLGVKRTPDVLPFCHPIPIDHTAVRFEIDDEVVKIEVEVTAIARTGVEVEAMTGAAIVALNVYDMVKPIEPGVSLGGVRLLTKREIGRASCRERV